MTIIRRTSPKAHVTVTLKFFNGIPPKQCTSAGIYDQHADYWVNIISYLY